MKRIGTVDLPGRMAGRMSGRDDELLKDVPDQERELGTIAGYKHGSRMRRLVLLAVVVSVVAAVLGGRWWAQQHTEQRGPAVEYRLADGESADQRPRELVWTSGRARLGLSRAAPGVDTIRLPDRVIRLADGWDHAQIRVEVTGGVTRNLEVLSGRIEQELTKPATLPEPQESAPDPAAIPH